MMVSATMTNDRRSGMSGVSGVSGVSGWLAAGILAVLVETGCSGGGETAPEATDPGGAAGTSVAKMSDTRTTGPEEGTTMAKTETAIIAGGCFWGMEDLLRKIDGVLDTDVGYCGGENAGATYESHPGHAEAVRIEFDPSKISFENLLVNWFFRMHDPTTLNRQGNDRGSSYRSTIFYFDDAQKEIAERAIATVDAAKRWPGPIVTTVEAVKHWTDAEGYHQDYLEKNPGGYTCHFLRDWTPIPVGE